MGTSLPHLSQALPGLNTEDALANVVVLLCW